MSSPRNAVQSSVAVPKATFLRPPDKTGWTPQARAERTGRGARHRGPTSVPVVGPPSPASGQPASNATHC